jgi:hypothetical protein
MPPRRIPCWHLAVHLARDNRHNATVEADLCAHRPGSVGPYTASMSLKTAAFFALIGMLLLTILDAAGFLRDLSGFLRDAVAAISLLESAIRLLASLSVTVFLFVFYRAQS